MAKPLKPEDRYCSRMGGPSLKGSGSHKKFELSPQPGFVRCVGAHCHLWDHAAGDCMERMLFEAQRAFYLFASVKIEDMAASIEKIEHLQQELITMYQQEVNDEEGKGTYEIKEEKKEGD